MRLNIDLQYKIMPNCLRKQKKQEGKRLKMRQKISQKTMPNKS